MKNATFYVLIISLLGTFSCNKEDSNITSNPQNTRTIEDIDGRQVVIPSHPERIVLGDNFLEVFAVGGDDIYERVVGWSATPWVKWRNTIYKEFASAVPRLRELTDVGLTFNQTFDVEVFIGLAPDLFILPYYYYDALDDGSKELISNAGIPVVFTDFATGTLELQTKSIEILGEVFGTQERAKQISASYREIQNTLASRLEDISEDARPTVYLELAINGPTVFGETYGDGATWGPIIKRAGGNNISAKLFNSTGFADNEFVLSEDPEFIFFTGSTWPSKPDAVNLGFTTDSSNTKRQAQRYIDERTAWTELTAIRNKHVYMVHHGFIRSILDYVPTVYMAQKMYPELFSDMDAEEIATEFYNQYLPVSFHGTWLESLY